MFIKKLLILLLCATMLPVFGQEKFLIKNGRKKDRIGFELINNLIIVPVELNGTELSFLVDTGVKTTVLLTVNEEDTLLLNSAEKIFLRGIGGEELIEAFRSSNNEFKIGKTTNSALTIYVIYDEEINFSPRLGIPVHGIIGYDLFKDFVVEINYQKRFLRLHDPEQFGKKLKKFSRVPLEFFQDKPYATAELTTEGRTLPATLLLDNGLGDALWLFPDGENFKVPERHFSDHLGMGLLGDVEGVRASMERMKLGKEVLENILVSYPDSLSVEGLKTYDARNGSIGAETLRRFHLFFDYRNSNLFLRGNKWKNDPFRYDMSGIVLEHSGFTLVESYQEAVRSVSPSRESNEIILAPSFFRKFELKPTFRVARLRPGSPAFFAGVQVGDEVWKVNKRPAWKMDLNDFTALFTSEEGKKIKIEVKRNGRKLEYEFELENPLKTKSPS